MDNLLGVTATLVGSNRVAIRERRGASGADDVVIYIPITFAPNIIAQLSEAITQSEG